MKYTIEKWTIEKLLSQYDEKKLILSPPYQRNDIWTVKAQKELISSIKNGMPIPNFFLHEKVNGIFDVADGQQRTRAILAYRNNEIADLEEIKFDKENNIFNTYLIPVVIINKSVSEEEIRKFYVKVNNTGLRLNSPELTKSEFFDSKILNLVEELSSLEEIQTLGLFSAKQEDRMLDREFMEELTAQLMYGITDKKLAIRKLYTENTDISKSRVNEIKSEFKNILNVFGKINEKIPLKLTRYHQKNDFYTLFGLIKDFSLKESSYYEIFNFLVKIQDDISPSNDKCPLLQEYAFNCITQSHGKTARERRYEILNSIAFNDTGKINKEQRKLIKYYGLKTTDVETFENITILDPIKILSQYNQD